jgi:hypothetical protein
MRQIITRNRSRLTIPGNDSRLWIILTGIIISGAALVTLLILTGISAF